MCFKLTIFQLLPATSELTEDSKIIAFSCFDTSPLTPSPAGVWGLQLDNVYLLSDIWTREDTSYGCLRLDITPQVVQRQELVVEFTGVRKYRV